MSTEQEKLGAFPFVVGGLSFIPGLGLIFGIIAIIWGGSTKKAGGRKLMVVGACGIALSIVLYSSLFYFGFVRRGGMYDDLRKKLAESTITSLVQAIEFYKVQNGRYPDSLETLQKSLPKESMVFVNDPTDTTIGGKRTFYYEVVDSDHYYLLGVGQDGIPFTSDDILPNVVAGPNSHVGLIIKGEHKGAS